MTDPSFKDSMKELEETYASGSYKIEFIKRNLNDNEKLRKTFAQLMLLSPARFGEIQQKVFVTRKTTYGHLYQLIELGLAKQIAIMDLWNKEEEKMDGEKKEYLKLFDLH